LIIYFQTTLQLQQLESTVQVPMDIVPDGTKYIVIGDSNDVEISSL
jgi:hypothetical protein